MLYEKIVNYCKDNNMPISSFEKKCNIGNGIVGKWGDGKYKPSLQTIEKISNATGIAVSEWVKEE